MKNYDQFASNIGELGISNLAQKFKNVLKLSDSNDNIVQIITNLGGTLSYDDPIHWKDEQIASIIVNSEKKSFHIITSKYLSEEEKTYAIAHELGHYVLHSELGKNSLELPLFGNGILEDEADTFAYNLLMPTEVFKKASELLDNSIIAMSVKFNVPPYIVQNKINELK